ncbi:unnamed protein product, partial [Polarella glacialis]
EGQDESKGQGPWHWHLQVGSTLLSKALLRPGRWHEVTLVVKCKEGRATVFVDGRQVKTDAGENTVDISGSSAVSPMAIKRGGFLLFAASQATWMPGGCMLRRCS